MNKTLLIALVGILILVVGSVMYWAGNQPNGEPQGAGMMEEAEDEEATSPAPVNETVVVTYTDSGYSPGTVNISNGSTIRFVNQSSGLMWTASNPHPSHHIFPEFDARRGISVGGDFSFTFTQAGSWGFHNHLNPAHTGEIVVR